MFEGPVQWTMIAFSLSMMVLIFFVVPAFIAAVLEGRRPTVNGKGDVTRDFTYVDDIARGTLSALRPMGFGWS